MSLTDVSIKALKTTGKKFSVSDGKGLTLEVAASGSKLWRLRYYLHGKEKVMSLGPYPDVSLAQARSKRDEARAQLHDGSDPGALQKQKKLIASIGSGNTFIALADEFIEAKIVREGFSQETINKTRWLLAHLDAIAKRPVADIKPIEILAVLKKVEKSGKHETAKRSRALASRIFRYAIATGRAEVDPAQALGDALTTPKVKHHAALIEPEAVGQLLRDIDNYAGAALTKLALQIAPHVLTRPGELRQARWEEIDFEKAEWRIPAERMKARRAHGVPLSSQVIVLLRQLYELTGPDGLLFPAAGKPRVPMSENTMNQALRRMGYTSDTMTPHGFRTTGSTLLNESGKWHPDAIERALAHGDSDIVRGTYNRGQYWDERVKMMQWWSDYLDQLRARVEIKLLQIGNLK